MYKNFLLFSIILILFFSGCGVPKKDYDYLLNANNELHSRIRRLEMEIRQLSEENRQLKETDQYYYQSGVDEFSKKNFTESIALMNQLKLKFPQSPLLSSADKIINDANSEIAAIYQAEKTNLDTILANARRSDIEDAISLLTRYINGRHPNDLLDTARNALTQYRADFEKIRTEREIERIVGVRLIDYSTGWNYTTFFGGQKLFVPNLSLNFQNISNSSLPLKTTDRYGFSETHTINVKVDFIQTSNNEIWGSDDTYLVGYNDNMLPGYSKTIYIHNPRGYTREWSSYELNNLPTITANIYINNQLYKTVNIRKGYRTN